MRRVPSQELNITNRAWPLALPMVILCVCVSTMQMLEAESCTHHAYA